MIRKIALALFLLAGNAAAFNAHAPAPKMGLRSFLRKTVLLRGGADRTFAAAEAKGGVEIDPAKTAVLCIEYQNEFTTEGGKLYDSVKDVMASTNMMENSVGVCDAARAAGAKVFHAPITFAEDASDNPNKGLGILGGCAFNVAMPLQFELMMETIFGWADEGTGSML